MLCFGLNDYFDNDGDGLFNILFTVESIRWMKISNINLHMCMMCEYESITVDFAWIIFVIFTLFTFSFVSTMQFWSLYEKPSLVTIFVFSFKIESENVFRFIIFVLFWISSLPVVSLAKNSFYTPIKKRKEMKKAYGICIERAPNEFKYYWHSFQYFHFENGARTNK